MGLFSGEDVTTVATQAMRAISDALLPDSVRSGTISAILGDQVIPDLVLENLITGVGNKAERLYDFAKTQYPPGLPSGQYLNANDGADQVQAVLDSIEGAPVTIVYSRLCPPNRLHLGWMRLVADYGYDFASNELATLSAQKGYPVYLTDMVPVLPQAKQALLTTEMFEQWGPPPSTGAAPATIAPSPELAGVRGHTPVGLDAAAANDYLRISYAWEQGVDPATYATNVVRETMTLPFAGYDPNAEYLHVRYTVGGQVKYWLYQVGAGTYPTLDGLTNAPPQELGTFFPFAYFRYNKADTTADVTTPEYQATRRMLRYLGIDYAELAANINDNPDIADVEQALLMFAVPASTVDPLERRYLFDFFDALYYGSGGTQTSATLAETQRLLQQATGVNPVPRATIIIQDKKFKLSVSHAGIVKSRNSGKIAASGGHASGTRSLPRTVRYTDIDGNPASYTQQVTHHYFQHQVTDNVYDEVLVAELQVKYHIWGDYAVTASDTDTILLIPIDRAISAAYNIAERERLYARSLHYVFNSRVITHLAWYQTGIFQVIILVIAVIITVVVGGSDGGQAVAAALGATGTTALVINVIATLVISEIVGKIAMRVFKLFVKVFGEDVAIFAAVVAVVYGGYELLKTQSLKGAPWAAEMLQVASGLTQAVLSMKMEDLLAEANTFSVWVKEQLQTLEDAKKALEQSTILSPFVLFGEKPDDYYKRTIHSGNVGVRSLDAPRLFVEQALTLPKLVDTLPGFA